jgi:hypothetical protein
MRHKRRRTRCGATIRMSFPIQIVALQPGRHVAHGPEQAVLGEGGVVVESD